MATPPPRRPSTAATRVSADGRPGARLGRAVVRGQPPGPGDPDAATLLPSTVSQQSLRAVRERHRLSSVPGLRVSERRPGYARNVGRTCEEHRPGWTDTDPRGGIC